MRPLRRFSTPPGMSETPVTSPRSSGRRGAARDERDRLLPAASTGATSRTRPEHVGGVRREHGDHAGRLGGGEAQVGPGDRVDAAHHRRELVGPARVVDEQVDGGAELGAALLGGRPRALPSAIERLCEAVEHLSAVVGGLPRPAAGERRARP